MSDKGFDGGNVHGVLLQCALRILLVVFVGTTLLFEPPNANLTWCVSLLCGYVVAIVWWSAWAVAGARREVRTSRTVTLLVLCADLSVVAVLSVLTAVASPDSWTADVLRYGLFLIPLIAAAQLDPYISAAVALPTVTTFLVVAWISQGPNDEPWASIILTTAVLTGLAAGSVALSLIQRAKVNTIAELAQQRTELLEEMVSLEKRERQALSERLHDGALQYVIVARQDLDEVRDGSAAATDRVDATLAECSRLLRDVVRELHPEVLDRSGLKAAVEALADSIAVRSDLDVEVEAGSWPDDLRTDADHVLYGAAREFSTNVLKHARAHRLRIELARTGGWAVLRIADDGVGISPERIAQSLADGHIGMASTRTKILAQGGVLDVRPTAPGTTVDVSIPLA